MARLRGGGSYGSMGRAGQRIANNNSNDRHTRRESSTNRIHEIIHFLISVIGLLVALYYRKDAGNIMMILSPVIIILFVSSIMLRHFRCKSGTTKEDCTTGERVMLGQGILMFCFLLLIGAMIIKKYTNIIPYIAIGIHSVWTVILALLFFVL